MDYRVNSIMCFLQLKPSHDIGSAGSRYDPTGERIRGVLT